MYFVTLVTHRKTPEGKPKSQLTFVWFGKVWSDNGSFQWVNVNLQQTEKSI